jgi:hypothetical protein
MPHVAILYYQLQTRGIDSIKIQRAVDTFKQQILLVRNKIRVEDAGPSTYIYWLLFLAVRNKYCSICSRTVGSKSIPSEHLCFRNWAGPSTALI